MKARFMIDTFKFLDNEAIRLVTEMKLKGLKKVNGNAVNSIVKKVTNSAYDTNYWFNGEYSTHTTDKQGNPYKIQVNMPNWYTYLNSRIQKYIK